MRPMTLKVEVSLQVGEDVGEIGTPDIVLGAPLFPSCAPSLLCCKLAVR